MPHPLLEHVERDAVHRRVDPEPVPQTFRGAVRRVRYSGLDHDRFDDLPDPHPAQWPDGCRRLLAGLLGLPDTVGGVEGVQVVWWHWNVPVHESLGTRGILALLEAADCDRPAREVDPSWRDLYQLGRPTTGKVQSFTERAIASRLSARYGQEVGALFGVQIEPVSGGVVEGHFTHI